MPAQRALEPLHLRSHPPRRLDIAEAGEQQALVEASRARKLVPSLLAEEAGRRRVDPSTSQGIAASCRGCGHRRLLHVAAPQILANPRVALMTGALTLRFAPLPRAVANCASAVLLRAGAEGEDILGEEDEAERRDRGPGDPCEPHSRGLASDGV